MKVIIIRYIEIIIQVIFRIWFCIPTLHWATNNIHAHVDLIQSGINLQYIPTPLPL